MAAPSAEDVFQIGVLVNNTYRIEEVLGRGGMGEVYLARHEITERRVAIKALKSRFTDNDVHVALMKREEAVRAVSHPAVIRYIDLGRTSANDLYLVMDFVEGEPLDKRMRTRPLSVAETLILARRVAEGLAVCHAQGVIHRDLSPDNILLRGGRVDDPVIIDFGIAKDLGSDQTVTGGQFAGKYKYAPLEQIQGRVDPRSDLYALGVTLLAGLRGQPPSFGANDFELMQNKARPIDVADIPAPLGPLIAALTDPDAEMRPASAGALIAQIDAVSGAGAAMSEATVVAAPGVLAGAVPGSENRPSSAAGQLTGFPQDQVPASAAQPGTAGIQPVSVIGTPHAAPMASDAPAAADGGAPGELTAFLSSAPTAAADPDAAAAAKPRRKRKPKSSGGMVGAVLVLIALGGGVAAWQAGLLGGRGGADGPAAGSAQGTPPAPPTAVSQGASTPAPSANETPDATAAVAPETPDATMAVAPETPDTAAPPAGPPGGSPGSDPSASGDPEPTRTTAEPVEVPAPSAAPSVSVVEPREQTPEQAPDPGSEPAPEQMAILAPPPETPGPPALRAVDPYRVGIFRGPDGAVSVTGHMPSTGEAARLAEALNRGYGVGTRPLPLASGAPRPSLGTDLAAAAAALVPLAEWQLSLDGNSLRIEGLAPDDETSRLVKEVLASLPELAPYDLLTVILSGPRVLSAEAIETALDGMGGCGPLIVSGERRAFEIGETVPLSGAVLDAQSRREVATRLRSVIGTRPAELDLLVLNPPVCMVRALLPPEETTDFGIWFGFGNRPGGPENVTGAYAVGENPLIDIRLPKRDSWGHLHVVAVDVAGTVFHLLPNTNRLDTRLDTLGETVGPDRRVRVAYALADRAEDSRRIAFTIEETFGKTLVIAFHTQAPLFEGPRPIAEPAPVFADALADRIEAGALEGAEITTRLLATREE